MAARLLMSARGSRDHDGAGDGRRNGLAPRRRQLACCADGRGQGVRGRRPRQGAGKVRRVRPAEGRDRWRREGGGVRLCQHGASAGAGRGEAQRPCGAVRAQPAVRAGAAGPRRHAGRAARPHARPASQTRYLDAEGRSVGRLRLGGFSQSREARARALLRSWRRKRCNSPAGPTARPRRRAARSMAISSRRAPPMSS